MKKLTIDFDLKTFKYLLEQQYKITLSNNSSKNLVMVSTDGPFPDYNIVCVDMSNKQMSMYNKYGNPAEGFEKCGYLKLTFECPYEPGDILVSRFGSVFIWDGRVASTCMSSAFTLYHDGHISMYDKNINDCNAYTHTANTSVNIYDVACKATNKDITKVIEKIDKRLNQGKFTEHNEKDLLYKYRNILIKNKLLNNKYIEIHQHSSNNDFTLGEMVLCKNRQEDMSAYRVCAFAYYDSKNNIYHVIGGNCYDECIPYIGNEHIFENIKQYYNESL